MSHTFLWTEILQKVVVTWHSLVAFHCWSCRYVTCLFLHQCVTQLCAFPLSLFLEHSLWQQTQLMSRGSTEIIYVICDIKVSKSMLQAFILWERMFYLEQRNAFYLLVPGVFVPSVVIIHVKRYIFCKIQFLLEGRDTTSGNKIAGKLIFCKSCESNIFQLNTSICRNQYIHYYLIKLYCSIMFGSYSHRSSLISYI